RPPVLHPAERPGVRTPGPRVNPYPAGGPVARAWFLPVPGSACRACLVTPGYAAVRTMSDPLDYQGRVEALERGECPPASPDLDAAVRSLMDELCAVDWPTAEEREQAQALIFRLERLKRPGQSAP